VQSNSAVVGSQGHVSAGLTDTSKIDGAASPLYPAEKHDASVVNSMRHDWSPDESRAMEANRSRYSQPKYRYYGNRGMDQREQCGAAEDPEDRTGAPAQALKEQSPKDEFLK
jgi:hypothetical protein